MLSITLQGEQITLLAERALLWPAQKTLIVSDLHWGKAGHFRKHGIAVPVKTQEQDEIRLSKLVHEHDVERLIVAGDLFHSKQNNEVDGFSHWRKSHSGLRIDLVIGNHDILPEEKYLSWDIHLHKDCLQLDPFHIMHDIPESCEQFCIHGHVHPAVRLTGKGNQALKLDCFCEDGERFILPSFGQFTGNKLMNVAEHKHIYVIADDKVMQWK
jgi:DNA ligase-associated metallophosphoesterase